MRDQLQEQEAQWSPEIDVDIQPATAQLLAVALVDSVVREALEEGLAIHRIWAWLREGREEVQHVPHETSSLLIRGVLYPRPHIVIEAPLT